MKKTRAKVRAGFVRKGKINKKTMTANKRLKNKTYDEIRTLQTEEILKSMKSVKYGKEQQQETDDENKTKKKKKKQKTMKKKENCRSKSKREAEIKEQP